MITSTISQSRKGARRKKAAPDADGPSVIRFPVPVEKAFYFFTDVGEPTGICSTSIYDFLEQLKQVDLKSLQFHFARHDFSRWLRDVVQESELADDFDGLHAVELSGEEIRMGLVELAEKRCKELADAQRPPIRSTAPSRR